MEQGTIWRKLMKQSFEVLATLRIPRHGPSRPPNDSAPNDIQQRLERLEQGQTGGIRDEDKKEDEHVKVYYMVHSSVDIDSGRGS
jgi:hypothetical protein